MNEQKPMNQLEQNITQSFRLAKSDIIKMHQGFLSLSEAQKRTVEMLDILKEQEINLYQRMSELDQIEEKEIKLYEQMKDLSKLKHVKTLLNNKTAEIEMLKASHDVMKKQLRALEKKLETQSKTKILPKTVKIEKTKTTKTRGKKVYIAAKNSKKFHEKNCPFAQNIKPKNSIKFKSKAKPLNLGLKKCNCVK